MIVCEIIVHLLVRVQNKKVIFDAYMTHSSSVVKVSYLCRVWTYSLSLTIVLEGVPVSGDGGVGDMTGQRWR
jgi:hypothetical protein